MGRPKKTTPALGKSHNTRASKSTLKSQVNCRVSKLAAKPSPALKNKVSAIAGNRSRSGDSSSDDPQADNLHADDSMSISISAMLAEYCGPIDEESARIGMADALYLYQWNLLAHYENEKFSNKGSPTVSTTSNSSLSSPGSPELDGAAGLTLERGGDTKKAITPSSPSSSLSSHESHESRGAEEGTKEGQGAALKPASNGSNTASASPSKTPRGQACTRCKTRKLKCDMSATCASCAQAGATCVRPLQRASQ